MTATLAGTRRVALARDELIGLRVEVVGSGDPGLASLAGTVADETQRTLVLDTPAGAKVVPKPGQQFRFTLPDGSTETVEGAALAHRPEERIKKAARNPARRTTRPPR